MDLNAIKEYLTSQEMEAKILPPSDDLPLDHLAVSLDPDYKNRKLTILMWIDSEAYLQVMLLFPFHFVDETLLSTGRYLLMINKSLAFAGFGLSEPDHAIYYRYTISEKKVESIYNFIGFIAMIYDTFAPKIEPLASGDKTFEETLWKE
jgi:hypothetical protein